MKKLLKKINHWFEMHPPEMAGLEEWDEIDKKNKIKYPIRHFLNDVLIPGIWWPIERFYGEIVSYIRFGFFEKLHLIDTKLPHNYQEVDTRLLHGMFSLLVDFVEVEKAWMETIFNKNYKRPWWKLNSRFRERELGIKYLDWEITLINNEHDNIQGENAKIIKDLYLWWVDERSKRKDPYVLMDLDNWDNISKEEKSSICKQISKIEQDEYDEDTEMLKKLIEVRGSLWT